MRTPEQNKELAREFGERVFNQHDIGFANQTLAGDFVEHEEVPGMTSHDRTAALHWFETMFKAVPDMMCEIHHVIASGGKVAIHGTYRGTDEGGMMPRVRDLLVRVAARDQAEDLPFASRELVELGIERGRRLAGEGVEDESGEARREHRVAVVDAPDGGDEVLGRDALRDVPPRASPD